MNAQDYVKSLFKDFEETEALRDFMEEIQGNLEERTASLIKKGLGEEEAFSKASSELGDISVLADQMSLKRRQEVYQEAYLGIQHYLKPKRVAAYVIFGITLVFGIIVALLTFFGVERVFTLMVWTPALGALLPFFVTSVAGFTFLGLTQETSSCYPVSKKRAGWYTAAASLIAFGIILFPLIFFAASETDAVVSSFTNLTVPDMNMDPFPFKEELSLALARVKEYALVPAIAAEIPFLLPGIGLLVFLCLTEKNRLKPWAAEHYKKFHKASEFPENPANMIRFGLFSGAIWIFAIGLFIALGFTVGFKFSWLIFVFATAVQLLVQGILFKENAGKKDG